MADQPRLQGGRGYLRGSDAPIAQSEEFARQARELPRQDEWLVSILRSCPYRAYASSAVAAANRVLFARLLPMARGGTMSRARLVVSGGVAAQTLQSGIYAYSGNQTKTLMLLSESRVTFFLDAAATINTDLVGKPTLVAEQQYFVGVVSSSAAVTFGSSVQTAGLGDPETFYYKDAGAAVLPDSVPLSICTGSLAVAAFPVVTYLSPEAAQVL